MKTKELTEFLRILKGIQDNLEVLSIKIEMKRTELLRKHRRLSGPVRPK